MFTRRPLFVIVLIYIVGIAFGYIFVSPGPVDVIAGELPQCTGRVMKIARSDSGVYRFIVRVRGERVAGGRNVLLRVKPEGVAYGEALPDDYDFESALLGRVISFSGETEMPTERRNPGCFDYSLYLKTQSVRVIVKCADSDLEKIEGKDLFGDIYNGIGRLKYDFFARSKAVMTKASFALMSGMLFGDTSELEDEVYERFQHHGIAHILSVSGIHVMIVYAFITMLLGHRKTTIVYLIIAAGLIFYAVLSEFSPTVVRAVVMIGVHILSKLMKRRYDLLNGTALAALLMLIYNPLSLFQAGFQLSFLAVFLLAFFMPLTARFLERRDARTGRRLSSKELEERGYAAQKDKLVKKAVSNLAPLLIIQIGMAPLVAYNFNYISWSGLFLNIPVVFLSELVIPIGLVMFIASAVGVSDFIFNFVAKWEQIIIEGIDRIVRLADSVLDGAIQVVSPPAPLLFMFYGLLFLLSSEGFRLAMSRRSKKLIVFLLAAVVSASLLTGLSNVCTINKAALTFVDVGQGDCLHVRTPDGRNYLIDGGGKTDYDVGKNVLLPYLLKNGVSRIDGVFASHLHTDHWKGIEELSQYMEIGTSYLYEANSVKDLSVDNVCYLAQGDRVTLGQGVYLDVLYPSRKTIDEYEALTAEDADENKSSLLMQLNYDGVTTLMTGDLGEEGERMILSELEDAGKTEAIRSRILKVGHHGSRTSTGDDFLAAVSPDIAVIQVGRNTYGHPTQTVLEKLAVGGIMTYRNDTDGAAMFGIKNGRIFYGGTQFQKNRTRYKR